MRAPLRSFGFIAVVLLAGLTLAGCRTRTSGISGGRSSGGTKSGSREVKFSLDGGGGIWTQADASTVTFAEGKVVVEKARVLFNDKEVAQFPEDTKIVEVDYIGGTLTITAD